MKYISLMAHVQETGGEKYSSHVDAIGSKMEGFVQLAHEAELVKLALRQLEGSITAHDPDEVRRRFFILFYLCVSESFSDGTRLVTWHEKQRLRVD